MRAYGTVKQVVARAKAIGCDTIGIADYCSTWGHVPFTDQGLKVLYGVTLPVVCALDKTREADLFTLIPWNQAELRQLYELVSLAHSQTYYRPRVTYEQLDGFEGFKIWNDGSLGNYEYFKKLRHRFVGVGATRNRLTPLLEEENGIIAAGPVFPEAGDREKFNLLRAIASNAHIDDIQSEGIHFAREGELRSLMKANGVPFADKHFDAARKIASECNVALSKAKLVHFEGTSLEEKCDGAMRVMGLAHKIDYQERLSYELRVIKEKNFDDYFHFVADLCSWARPRMLVGPARGSSAGSLVCFLLGITTVDPLVHGTLFDRFIDVTRNDWPDIDLDFPDVRRDEVFGYLRETYGADRVARLGTLSELGGKSAINDTAKAVGVPIAVARDAGRLVEQFDDLKIAELFKLDQLKKTLEDWPALAGAAWIDGHVRHAGVHAAGVVVGDKPITTYSPVDKAGTVMLTMGDAEKQGLIKMDALGLRTLSVIQDCCDEIGSDPRDLYKLDWKDPKVFKLFQDDHVTGIFQFEGYTVRDLMKGMKPKEFADLCALTSLARPGPLVGGAAAAYVKRHSGNEEWSSRHAALAPILNSTYGVIVYQEQAMAISRVAGFSVADVNGFRRAIGKKDPEKLRAYRPQFIEGLSKVVGAELAETLWDELNEFGSYAFNWAHAVSYSMLSYMTAWLKTYHPLEFALAQLKNAKEIETGKALLRELRLEGHDFVAFDPQLSEASWSIKGGKLVGGFDAIRGVGKKTAEVLLAAREKHGAAYVNKLTDAQRKKILTQFNTPWHDLDRLGQLYGGIYSSPDEYGIGGPIHKISEIPERKGSYVFIGTLRRVQVKDKNAPEEVAKRNGQRMRQGQSVFCNLFFEDDTGEIGSTINRFKFGDLGEPLIATAPEGKDFVVRGDIINDDGRKWIFIENIMEAQTFVDRYNERRSAKSGEGSSGALPEHHGEGSREGLPAAAEQAAGQSADLPGASRDHDGDAQSEIPRGTVHPRAKRAVKAKGRSA